MQGVRVDGAQESLGFEVLFQRSWGMDWVVFVRGIFARELQDDLGTAGVFGEEVGDLR